MSTTPAPLLAIALLVSLTSEAAVGSPPPSDCEALLASDARSLARDLEETAGRLETCRETARREGDRVQEAEILRLLAILRGHHGRWPASLRAAEEALVVARRAGEPEMEAWALMTLGDAEFYVWRFEEAARHFEAAAELFREAGNSLGHAHALKNLGIAYKPLGRRDLAILHLERAMERYPEWRDDELAVSILGNLGTIYSKLDAPRSARRTLERALEIARDRGRADELSDLLGRLGYLYLRLGLPEEALGYFQEALVAARKAGPAADLPLLEGAAAALAGAGDEGAAEAALETLVAKHRASGNRIATCLALTALARFVEDDQPERAESMYGAAGGLAADRHLQCRWESLAGHARIALRSGHRDRAIDLLVEALDAVESQRLELISDHDRSSFAERTESVHRTLAALLIERAGRGAGEPDRELAFHVLERMRASALTRGIAEARLPPPGDLPEAQQRRLRHLEGEIQSLRERIQGLAPDDGGRLPVRELLRRREAELDEHLRNTRRALARRPPLAVTAPALRERLPLGTALVAYLVGEDRSFAFVVTPERLRVMALPGTRALLAEQVGGFLDLLGDRRSPGWATVGHRLYRDLVAPWAETLGPGVDALVIVPDREVQSLPFEALPRDADGRRLLVEDFAVGYAPSASALVGLAASSVGESPGATDLLVVADPRTVARDGDRARPLRALYEEDGHDLSPMPFGRVEGARVARYSRSSVTLTGSEATEARAKALELTRYGVVHFATHGLLSARDPRRSALLLGLDPESLEDGFLQAREIEHLRLDAELVVLSACRTARGRRMGGGAGVQSLAEAFFVAGARSVVGTLWNVQDRSAMRLMTAFYRHLADGRSKAEALQAAKIEALARGAAPADWAGFVLLGEPFTRVEVTRPRSTRALYSLGLVLLTALLAAGVVRSVRSARSRR